MCSIRLVCARPVRSFFSWSLNVDTHFAMRSAASFFNSSSMVPPLRPGGDDGADVLALNDSHEVAGIEQVEYLQRQVIFPTHDDGRGVHHVEEVIQHLVEGPVRVELDV